MHVYDLKENAIHINFRYVLSGGVKPFIGERGKIAGHAIDLLVHHVAESNGIDI